MSIDDELQRRFESAGRQIHLEPGSVEGVKSLASTRTRRSRGLASAAAIVMLIALGPLAYRLLQSSDSGLTEIGPEVADSAVAEEGADGGDNEVSEGGAPAGVLTEDGLTYAGSFAMPEGDFADSRFSYGGEVAAFNPFGDPDSTDGFDGSLFISGHPRQNLGIAEVSIPTPAPHEGAADGLPVAEVLAPFADITDGRSDEFVAGEAAGGNGEYRYGGLEVVDGPDGPRLHWAVWQYQNNSQNDYPSHGHSSLDLGDPDPQGPWTLDDYNSDITPGYIFSVPLAFADESLVGDRLITGYRQGGTSSRQSFGPPFISYDPPAQAEPAERVDALALVLYDNADVALDGFAAADVANGATWVDNDDQPAIITVGQREVDELAPGSPPECQEPAENERGPYEPQIMFYDPDDLARVVAGEIRPDEVEPYRRWNPADLLLPACDWHLSSVAYDATGGYLYIVQVLADDTQSDFSLLPVVHVFEVS